jgi:hypothetical protein
VRISPLKSKAAAFRGKLLIVVNISTISTVQCKYQTVTIKKMITKAYENVRE